MVGEKDDLAGGGHECFAPLQRQVSEMSTQAQSLVLLIFRLAVAGVFLAHGANHLLPRGKVVRTGRWFAGLGMRPGLIHAWTASLTELGAGIGLALGLLTPIASAGVVGTMVVAWIINHRKNGFFIFRPGEGWEYVMILTVCGLVLSVLGPGRWSIDAELGLSALTNWTGLLIALGAGGGGGLLLLATCWRPAKTSTGG